MASVEMHLAWKPWIPIALLCAGVAHAGCREDIAPAHLIGSGEFCILGFCLYNAQLWAERAPTAMDVPFALSLTYRRNIKGERLASTGMEEIQRLASAPLSAETLDTWHADMRRAFGDVASGDELCGVYLPEQGARFYANGKLTADIADPAFARAFFDIWLNTRTRAPRLRMHLLGMPS